MSVHHYREMGIGHRLHPRKDELTPTFCRVREVHLRDLFDASYPWRELFTLLANQSYAGYTLAEIPESPDPERVLRYFKALWLAFQPEVRKP